jgi:hypothetical protein
MTVSIPLTRGFAALVDEADAACLNQWKWRVIACNGLFYACRWGEKVDGKRRLVLMHRAILDAPKGMVVDHVNGDGLDNTRANIRLATHFQNNGNRRTNYNSATGLKGVVIRKNQPGYSARIMVNGVGISKSGFKTAEAAKAHYDMLAAAAFGEFARYE